MGHIWDDDKPLWKAQGRTGPNGPRYAKRKDRKARGGECCPMVAAAVALRSGRPRLARRYAMMSLRVMASRVLSAS